MMENNYIDQACQQFRTLLEQQIARSRNMAHTAKDFGAEVGFKDGKHELFPFPYTVTSINPNITQNPGWTK